VKYVFALDPSLSNTGVAIFDEKGNIIKITSFSTTAKDNHANRLVYIYDFLTSLRNKYPPCALVCENGFSRFNKATQNLWKLIGVIQLMFVDVEQCFYSPTHIKKVITGNGKALKEDVQKEILKKYRNIKFVNLDESDSCAVGFVFLIERKIIKW
jgi:Holliday junction resolvasome RuvABC endonuclease subunit